MQFVAFLQTKVALTFPMEELNPQGRAILLPMTKELVGRYQFLNFPQKWEDYVPQQGGILYSQGEWKGIAITQLSISSGGLLVETRSSSEEAEAFLNDILLWVPTVLGLPVRPEMVRRRIYSSNLSFRSDIDLFDAMHPRLPDLSARITSILAPLAGREIPFKVRTISFTVEPTETVPGLTVTIERRAGHPFSENIYFSSAPFPTQELLGFLADFESAVTGS